MITQITSGGAALTWAPLTSLEVGWKGLSAEEIREAAFADVDPQVA